MFNLPASVGLVKKVSGGSYDTSPATKYGATAASVPPGIGFDAWNNVSNAQNTGLFADCAVDKNDNGSEYMQLTNFGFNLPPSATVTGIVVNWYKYATNGGTLKGLADQYAQIVKGGTVGATNYANSSQWPASATAVSYGTGTTDLWGETWAASDINASNFGAVIGAATEGPQNQTAYVGYCQITVYFS